MKHVLSASIPRVLVLGAAFGARASLRAARAAGFEVIAADAAATAGALTEANEQHVIRIDDAAAVTELARQARVDGVVATTDHAVYSAATAAAACGLRGISPDVAIRATDKAAMRAWWDAHGIPGPRTTTAITDDDVLQAAAQLGLPLVLKPAHALGGGSRGVSMARDHSELASAAQFARQFAADGVLLIEQCIDARSEHSVEVLFVDGVAHVLAIGDKVKSAAPYRVDLEVCYPTTLEGRDLRDVKAIAVSAARTLGIEQGMAHVELACTDDGVMLFELGARCGGGATAAPLVPFVYGIDEFAESCRVACGIPPVQLNSPVVRGGCYRFVTPHPGITITHAALPQVRVMRGVLEAEMWADEGTQATSVRTGRDRAGAIVTGADDREMAIRLASQAAAVLERGMSRAAA